MAAGLPVQMGFLLGTRAYNCHCALFPDVGVAQVTVKEIIAEADHVSLFACTIAMADSPAELLAEGTLKVIQPDDVTALIQDDVQ